MSLTLCKNGHFYNADKDKCCPFCKTELLTDSGVLLDAWEAPPERKYALRRGDIANGRYEVIDEIGWGGVSVVYLVKEITTGQTYALKRSKRFDDSSVMPSEEMLSHEVQMMRKLRSPYFPRLHAVSSDDFGTSIVMDYVPGYSIESILEWKGSFSQEETVRVACELCRALQYLHTCKPPIIYRDMKTANVILEPDDTVHLIDFGIAKELTDDDTRDEVALGTRGFAAPEQFGGRTDERSDIYSLGITLYRMVTGKPVVGKEILPIRQINPDLSYDLEYIILKCTAWEPQDRYQNAAELLGDLEALERGGIPYLEHKTALLQRDYVRMQPPVYNTYDEKQVMQTAALYDWVPSTAPLPQSSSASGTGRATLPVKLPPVNMLSVPADSCKKYIFISYAHSDGAKAAEVIQAIMDCGFRVWFDSGIDPGSEWAQNIVEHIRGCGFFISLMSANYLKSEHCIGELNYTVGRIPNRMMIYLEDIKLPDRFELHHGNIQAIHRYRYEQRIKFMEILSLVEGLDRAFLADETDEPILLPEKSAKAVNSVFVSYSTDDYLRYARLFVSRLEAQDMGVWHKMAQASCEAAYEEEAKAAIKKAETFVFFMDDAFQQREDGVRMLRQVMDSGVDKNCIFGVLTGNNPALLADYFNCMTVTTCRTADMIPSLAEMVVACRNPK